jgi:DNA-binding response OmpR family regulator
VSVLLVHHEETEARSLANALEHAGFDATVEPERFGLEPIALTRFDVVVIGTSESIDERAALCRRLRGGGYLGSILMLGIGADDVGTLVDAGADDFVAAPVRVSELLVRVRMAHRRIVTGAQATWGRITIDRVRMRAYLRGREIALTAREYALLSCLVDAAGQTVSRSELLAKVWSRDADPGSNLVEVHLSRLRDKLGSDAEMIETVRRAGYRLRK